jgi:hypothetical protein
MTFRTIKLVYFELVFLLNVIYLRTEGVLFETPYTVFKIE